MHMKKIYFFLASYFLLFLMPAGVQAQPCSALQFTYTAAESRCVSTGSFSITATGGSGSYNYKVTGPVNSSYTSSSVISGLRPGNYTITVKDVVTGCEKSRQPCIITGNYLPPNFTVTKTNETCMNAGNGTITVTSATQGRSPFTYTIIAPSASQVGVTSSAGLFTGLKPGNYLVQQKDSCGNIQTRGVNILPYSWWILNYDVVYNCGIINVTITLRDNLGNTNNGNALFNAFRYGVVRQPGDTVWSANASFNVNIGRRRAVTLVVKDGCGNMRKQAWVNNNRPAVAASVSISNLLCASFTARVTGQSNLTNPVYCIYNSANVQLACNNTGQFSNLVYGAYCIKITDACYDTTITRCFTQNKPLPSVAANVSISDITCQQFTATVTGWTNLFNPEFCLFRNPGNVPLGCNNTGVFTNLPFGSYCIFIRDAGCTDTVFSRCFTVQQPIPSAGPPVSFTRYCRNYTMRVTDTANLTSPQFCLYLPGNVLVECNSTGVFDNLLYGQRYCIQTQNSPGCYDTTITHCFVLERPVPAVNNNIQIANKTCTSFTAAVTGAANLFSPEFCIYNSGNVLLGCNTTGVFGGLPYGNYCITIKNNPACYDTVITRCFTQLPDPVTFTASASASCLAGNTNISVSFSAGTYPVSVQVLAPGGLPVASASASASPVVFSNFAPLPGGAPYKIICTDACGRKDSALVTPVPAVVVKNIVVDRKCPSVTWLTGSNDVSVTITGNMGTFTSSIIKKNNVAVTINYTTQTGNTSRFIDLEPAVYVFEHRVAGCSNRYYDTVTAGPYIFPQLQNAGIYQCDNNSFSVSAVAQNGIGPFTFEIIGNVPVAPSLITPPQASPVFNINNGTAYSLVRLRAVDMCGNAALNDANVLPLGNINSNQSSDCFYNSIVLSVDSIPNATFTWYKKISAVDSIVVATGVATYVIPYLLPPDTGRYVCRVAINNNCTVKLAYFSVTGRCNVLPLQVRLQGYRSNNQNQLHWQHDPQGSDVRQFVAERMTGNTFTPITTVVANMPQYAITDAQPLPGNNLYRLKISAASGAFVYSNLVLIKEVNETGITLFPNPVSDVLHLRIAGSQTGRYQYRIVTAAGTEVYRSEVLTLQNGLVSFAAGDVLVNGVYYLKCTELKTGGTTILPFVVRK
jgi:hypothetical protein